MHTKKIIYQWPYKIFSKRKKPKIKYIVKKNRIELCLKSNKAVLIKINTSNFLE